MSSTKFAWLITALVIIATAAGGAYVFKRVIMAPWDEEYAYTKGLQAVVYAFPYVLNSSLRQAWSQPAKEGEVVTAPKDAVNQFFLSPQLTDANYRDGGTPNNDTAYAITWAYVDKEPIIVSVPDVGTLPGSEKPRYFSFEIASFDSDNFAYIGTRTTGNKAGNYAIVPKGWKGQLPANVTQVGEAPTPWFLIVGRTLVLGPEDFPAVSAIIKQYKLRTLSAFVNNTDERPPAPPVAATPHYKTERAQMLAQFWQIANAAMTENPPSEADARLINFFADIEVGPGRDLSKLSEGMRRGLDRAALRGLLLIREASQSGYSTKVVNGWKYPPPNFGRAGLNGSFLIRAGWQSLGGIVANDPEEAVYLVANSDGNGQRLNGSKSYRMTFPKGQLPPTNAFWSLSMYDETNNLVANSINRYSLGDRTSGLQFNDDGSLTLYVGQKPPADGPESNWLPAPKSEFYMILRLYLPGAAVIEQRWVPPALEIK